MGAMKPPRWAVSPGLVTPEWRWAWNGLKHLWLFNEQGGHVYDHVGGHPVLYTVTGNTFWSYGTRGMGLVNLSGGTNPQIATANTIPYADDQLSVLTVFDNLSITATQDIVICHEDDVSAKFAWLLQRNDSVATTLTWQSNNDADNNLEVSVASYLTPVGKECSVMGTWINGHSELIADGVFRNSGDHATSVGLRQPTTVHGIGILGQEIAVGSRGFYGGIYLAAVWHKAFSREAAERITQDPFGFITPAIGYTRYQSGLELAGKTAVPFGGE